MVLQVLTVMGKSLPPIKILLTVLIHSSQTVGQKLAEAFDDGEVDDETTEGMTPHRFMFTDVTPDEVYKQLSKMPSGKATGT